MEGNNFKKLKILFVCTENKIRSKTAESLCFNETKLEVKSAGTAKTAIVQVDRELLEWSDIVFVMERSHRGKIRDRFPDIYQKKRIICLYIPDVYRFGEDSLVCLLQERLFEHLGYIVGRNWVLEQL